MTMKINLRCCCRLQSPPQQSKDLLWQNPCTSVDKLPCLNYFLKWKSEGQDDIFFSSLSWKSFPLSLMPGILDICKFLLMDHVIDTFGNFGCCQCVGDIFRYHRNFSHFPSFYSLFFTNERGLQLHLSLSFSLSLSLSLCSSLPFRIHRIYHHRCKKHGKFVQKTQVLLDIVSFSTRTHRSRYLFSMPQNPCSYMFLPSVWKHVSPEQRHQKQTVRIVLWSLVI